MGPRWRRLIAALLTAALFLTSGLASGRAWDGSLAVASGRSVALHQSPPDAAAPPDADAPLDADAPPDADSPADAAPRPGVYALGNRLVDESGRPIRLLGVNRSGAEYACIQGWGMFDGPVDSASIDAMLTWRINTVRVPLNEQCWLGIGTSPWLGGAAYQRAVVEFVDRLLAAGLYVEVELQWAAPSSLRADLGRAMPDAENSPRFWREVAQVFGSRDRVIFGLFSEPAPDGGQDTPAAWRCWRDGGECPGVPYLVAGHQQLVDEIRATGATNLIGIGGACYANCFGGWLMYQPFDPLGNTMAEWHSYSFSACTVPSCWDSSVAPLLEQVPLTATEIGEDDCGHRYVDELMEWLDSHGAGYLGWTWNTWDCRTGPALISGYAGVPSAYGVGLRDHLADLAATG